MMLSIQKEIRLMRKFYLILIEPFQAVQQTCLKFTEPGMLMILKRMEGES